MYGLQYERATVAKKSGKKNLQACVTIPIHLRPLLKNRTQIYKSLGTPDQREAYERLSEKEAEIWRELDQADQANHPLVQAAKKLEEVIAHKTFNDFEEFEWRQKDLFDNDLRWAIEDDLRSRASVSMDFGATDANDIVDMDKHLETIQPVYDTFLEEFRKVSAENFAPKKRGRLFSDVVEEYHASSLFKTNKKTNQPKRQKTLAKEIAQVNTFMRWAGEIDLETFTVGLANRYAEALVNPDNELINKRGKQAGKETVDSYVSSVRNVLDFARRYDYIQVNPWVQLGLSGYGAAREQYRDWTEDELRQVFSLDMPDQDRLCLAILACTGARLDEIALLEWHQFESGQTKDGDLIHWLDTTDAIVKNNPSRRLIPILPIVAKMIEVYPKGLNKKEPDRLFSYGRDKKDGKAENKASLALMKHLRKINKSDKTFAVHGLRHTFTSMCRTEKVDWELREFIMGRGGKGEGANYGKPAHVKTSLESIKEIDTSFLDGMLAIEKQSNKPYQMVSGWMGKKVDTGGGD